MSALKVSEVRQRIAATLTTVLASAGWRESTGPYELFAETDGDNRAHKGFAVGCPETTAVDDRQKVAEGVLVRTDVRVVWAWNLAGLAQVESADEALDAESLLIGALASTQVSVGLILTFVAARRTVTAGWMLGEIQMRGQHTLRLR